MYSRWRFVRRDSRDDHSGHAGGAGRDGCRPGLIPQTESTDPSDAADIVAQYAKLVHQVAIGDTQVVVLPEKTVGFAPSYEWDVVQGFQRIASMSKVWLVGRVQPDRAHAKRNIAVVFSPRRQNRGDLRQRHLIPGLSRMYKAGSKPAIFDAPWGRTAILISQDLDFPATARELAANDVRVVMAPASDSTAREVIHQRMAVVRGVEFGFRSLARRATAWSPRTIPAAGRSRRECPSTARTRRQRPICRSAPAGRFIREAATRSDVFASI